MRIETRARARALQALYAWDLRGQPNLLRLAPTVWDDLAVGPEERRIAGRIVKSVAESPTHFAEELSHVTTNWRLERLGVIDRCVLRIAAAELDIGETPPKVVIQEAVRLAERYGSGQSARFVNGVVDALARRMQLL
jgi:transcription antitermination protein NusB